jgi:hypothetical protein
LKYFGKPIRIFGLSDKEVDRVSSELRRELTVNAAPQEVSALPVVCEVMSQETGNEIFLDISDRPHINRKSNHCRYGALLLSKPPVGW